MSDAFDEITGPAGLNEDDAAEIAIVEDDEPIEVDEKLPEELELDPEAELEPEDDDAKEIADYIYQNKGYDE
jgi:hypothetical protein